MNKIMSYQLKIGDVVVVTSSNNWLNGKIGTVVELNVKPNLYKIKFNESEYAFIYSVGLRKLNKLKSFI